MVGTTKPPRKWTEPLIEHLIRMHRDDERGPLAELRRGAADWPDCGHRVLRHVVPFFSSEPNQVHENAMLLVAALYALNPGTEDPGDNMGDVMRKTAGARDSFDSIEARFMRLLDARDEIEIATHLRHAVQLAAGKGVAIGWTQLLRDLRGLLSGDEDWRQNVLRRWARSFWSKPQENQVD
jgi:CRISPR type I-E-associated protein CasB/Cse2